MKEPSPYAKRGDGLENNTRYYPKADTAPRFDFGEKRAPKAWGAARVKTEGVASAGKNFKTQ